MKVTIELSATLVSDLKEVMSHMRNREVTTVEQVLLLMAASGAQQSLYRYSRNAEKWQQAKADRALLAELLAEREQANKAGK